VAFKGCLWILFFPLVLLWLGAGLCCCRRSSGGSLNKYDFDEGGAV
jgi:hypothetical protein